MSGNGQIVDITEGPFRPSPNSMYSQIVDTIDYTRAYADDMRDRLAQAIEDLGDILENFDPQIPDFDTDLPDIDRPSLPQRPSFGELELDDNWPDDFPVDPVLMEIGNLDFDYVAPEPPAEIDPNFSWSPDQYTSDMWFALFSKVHGDIINGGNGLPHDVYQAILAREREARRVAQDREYRRSLDAVGARGFNLPGGMVAAIQLETMREMMAKDQDAINNIAIKDFDLAVENMRFAITTGVELEKILRMTYDSLQKLNFEAAKAAKDYLIAVYSENVKAYLAKWEGIKTRMEALKAKVDAIVSYNDGLVKTYLGKAEVFNARINAIVEKNKALVEERKAEVALYTAEVDAVSKEYALLIEEVKARMEAMRLEISAAIDEAKINLEAYTSKAQLSERISEAIAQISAQAIASALGAINTSMSHGYSGHESLSEAWSHSERLGESYSGQV